MTALLGDALDQNRAGRLTGAQRQTLRGMSRGTRKAELQFAAIFTVIGLLVWFAEGPARYANIKPLVGIAFLIIAGALVVRAFLGSDALTRDLRSGRVESVEGPVSKWAQSTSSGGSSLTSHYVQVGAVRAVTGGTAYAEVPEAGIVRMFFLPHSHHLVNIERLADRPLPEGALSDPRVAIKDAKQAVIGAFVGDRVKSAEARAELQAITGAMTGGFGQAAPPPPDARDPRPLAEAIIGVWRNPMMSVTFSEDGTVAATLPGGMERSGRWSVDGSGRLTSDVTGTEETADAWVAGDRLTLELGGRGVTLQRSA